MLEDAMIKSPAVSVLIPVFNGATYLSQATDSILAQTLEDCECMIIDDGYIDATTEILRDYAKGDPRVRMFFREHEGLVPALNFRVSQNLAPLCLETRSDSVFFKRSLGTVDCRWESGEREVDTGS